MFNLDPETAGVVQSLIFNLLVSSVIFGCFLIYRKHRGDSNRSPLANIRFEQLMTKEDEWMDMSSSDMNDAEEQNISPL